MAFAKYSILSPSSGTLPLSNGKFPSTLRYISGFSSLSYCSIYRTFKSIWLSNKSMDFSKFQYFVFHFHNFYLAFLQIWLFFFHDFWMFLYDFDFFFYLKSINILNILTHLDYSIISNVKADLLFVIAVGSPQGGSCLHLWGHPLWEFLYWGVWQEGSILTEQFSFAPARIPRVVPILWLTLGKFID